MSKYLEQSVDEFRIYVANCSYDELEFIDKFLDTKLVGYPADSVEVKDAFEAGDYRTYRLEKERQESISQKKSILIDQMGITYSAEKAQRLSNKAVA